MTPLALLATETPAGIPGWLWPLAVAGGGSIILAVIGGVWALIRYAVPRWVRETAKPASDRPSPMPQALTQTGGGGSVQHALGAHGATLEGLGARFDHLEARIEEVLAHLMGHHGRIATVEAIVGVTPIHPGETSERVRTGNTGRFDAAPADVPPAVPRQRTQSRGGQR